MSAPVSQNDPITPSYTAADLAFDVALTKKRIDILAGAMSALKFEGVSLDEACGRTSLQEMCRDFEGAVEGFREALCIVLTGREPSRGNVPALVAAVREFMEEREIASGLRPRDPLATAMRRADAAEAADAALTAGQRARGGAISAALYGTTETAPCADLTREAETYDYGKSAAANASASHGAYERSFVSPAAA